MVIGMVDSYCTGGNTSFLNLTLSAATSAATAASAPAATAASATAASLATASALGGGAKTDAAAAETVAREVGAAAAVAAVTSEGPHHGSAEAGARTIERWHWRIASEARQCSEAGRHSPRVGVI